MILADSSVWIDHLHNTNTALTALLNDGAMCGHPWVTGEVALGSVADRRTVITLLTELPQAPIANPAELLHLIDSHRLYSLGIGYVDAQLLASARLGNDKLWTHDKRLHSCAVRLGVAHSA